MKNNSLCQAGLVGESSGKLLRLNQTGDRVIAERKGAPSMASEKIKILVADDEKNIRFLISHNLKSAGYEVEEAEDGQAAIELATNSYRVALLDLQMPNCSGMEVLSHFAKNHPETQCILISAVGRIPDAVSAMSEGAFWYVQKPFEPEELLTTVKKALQVGELKAENSELRKVISDVSIPASFVGSAPSTDKIRKNVQKVANLDSTVLITGPSGTGKSTLARLIHQSGDRRDKSFVSVSCAALPRDLVEAELFGYEKGAFTGAISSRAGKIEVADGGTLFLDEIGDMPIELQPKLLTFLQDRIVQRIGSNQEQKFDVRIITATHKDLVSMCQEGSFREDLYYRINILSLEVPSLSERPEDIEPLALEILRRISDRRSAEDYILSTEALAKLRTHNWPGNVRELENVLERATAFAEGNKLLVEDINVGTSLLGQVSNKDSVESDSVGTSLVGPSLEEIEKRAITEVLLHCGGNKQAAADMLGVSQKSIYNKIKKYGI